MPAISPEAAEMHRRLDREIAEAAKRRREKTNDIEAMKQPFAMQIKEWDGHPVVSAVHLPGKGPGARKILPKEVVCIDAADPEMANAFRLMEPVKKPLTRPFIFSSEMQARATDPRHRKRMSEGEVRVGLEEVRREVLELNQKLQSVKSRRTAAELPSEAQQAALQVAANEAVEENRQPTDLTPEEEAARIEEREAEEGGSRRRRVKI